MEISVWKPHPGKWDQFLEMFGEVKKVFLEGGVAQVQIITGVAGKDIGNVLVVQYFKGLADNGALNEAFSENSALKEWSEKYRDVHVADLVSHDLYSVIEE